MKPLYVDPAKHKKLKAHAKKIGTKLNQLTDKVLKAGMRALAIS